MKLISYSASGRNSYGAVVGNEVYDLGRRLGASCPTLRDAISAGVRSRIDGEIRGAKPDLNLSQVTLMPPIPNPDKIVCIGLNYKAHVAESGIKMPEFPALFSRYTNTLAAHGAPMVRPKVSTDFDYEGELAVIIGQPGRHISEKNALKHVFGYTCFNDGSVRDYQFKHCITVGKNFPATGGLGPWIVTADEIPDPSKLTLTTRINGTQVQHRGVDDMIFTVQAIIAYVSTWTALVPGDVIATGTPEGVGFARKPPLWLKPGDVVEVDISGIGVLRNPIVAEA